MFSKLVSRIRVLLYASGLSLAVRVALISLSFSLLNSRRKVPGFGRDYRKVDECGVV